MNVDDPARVVVKMKRTEDRPKPLICDLCGKRVAPERVNRASVYTSWGTAHGRLLCDGCAHELIRTLNKRRG